MKKDIPVTFGEFVKHAIPHGFTLHENVGSEQLAALSLDPPGNLIRIFFPELRPTPDGTEIDGAIGLALVGSSNSVVPSYDFAVFQNIINYIDILECERIAEKEEALQRFLNLVKNHMTALPSTVSDVIDWAARGDNWLSKQLAWGRPGAVAFLTRAIQLAERVPDSHG